MEPIRVPGEAPEVGQQRVGQDGRLGGLEVCVGGNHDTRRGLRLGQEGGLEGRDLPEERLDRGPQV